MKRIRDRAGFTLVELLVVITIIGILAATAMFVMFKAESFGKDGKTRARITALDRLVMETMENYATRRLNIAADPISTYDQRKKDALDALLAMDFPDHWSEITGVPVASRSALSHAYNARYAALPQVPNSTHEPAECLYLIVSMAAKGLEYFNESDIGDTDGDGAFEFVDAWGRPIYFLRAPKGYPSLLVATQATTPVPLFYSGGPDKKFGLNIDPNAGPLGTPLVATPDEHLDNIHNHRILE